MRRKQIWTMALAGIALGTAACVCTSALPFGGGGDGPGIDVPSIGAPAIDLPKQHVDEYGGMRMSFPEGWVVDSFFGITIASSDAALVNDENADVFENLTAPVLVAFAGPLDEFEIQPGDTADSLIEDFRQSAFEEEGITFGQTGDVPVGGFDGRGVFFEGANPDTGQEVSGRLVAVLTNQQGAVFFGVAPADDWFFFADSFDAIIASVEFFEPNPEAFDEGVFGEEEPFVEVEPGGEVTGDFSLTIGGSSSAVLEDGGAHEWRFQGSAGQTVTVSVAPDTADLDAELALVGPDGSVLADVDDAVSGEAESITTTLPGDGTYTAVVTPFASLGGSYSISIGEGLVSGQTVGTLSPGATQNATLGEGERQDWLFSGTAGQTVTVTLSPDSDDLDPVLMVLGPDGSDLSGDVDSGFSGEDEMVTLILPGDGDYLARVRGFAGGSGPYTIGISSP